MTITRNQISKQTEPGLGNSDKKKLDKVILKTHGKVYKEKKSNKKILSLGHLLFKPKVIQSGKLYNRKKDKYITYKVATKTEE